METPLPSDAKHSDDEDHRLGGEETEKASLLLRRDLVRDQLKLSAKVLGDVLAVDFLDAADDLLAAGYFLLRHQESWGFRGQPGRRKVFLDRPSHVGRVQHVPVKRHEKQVRERGDDGVGEPVASDPSQHGEEGGPEDPKHPADDVALQPTLFVRTFSDCDKTARDRLHGNAMICIGSLYCGTVFSEFFTKVV